MSVQARETAIGAFVVGALLLAVAGIILFGSGKFFKDTDSYVLYFQENTKGLNVGAPARFRGVQIGTVNQLELVIDKSTAEFYTRVFIETDPDAIRNVESIPGVSEFVTDDPLNFLIEEGGLRAKLAVQSLVTAQLYIEFDFYPRTPIRLAGFDDRYGELPTTPSAMEELQYTAQDTLTKIRELPVQKLLDKTVELVNNLNVIVESPKFKQGPAQLHDTLTYVKAMADTIDAELKPLLTSLRMASDTTNATMNDVRKVLRDDRGKLVNVATRLDALTREARATFEQANDVVSGVDGHAIARTVDELAEAARSVRILTDYLAQHPEALLVGKPR